MEGIEIRKKNNWYETIIKFLCIVSLFFSFTNYIFVSAISALTVVFFIPLLFKNGGRINYLAFFIFCFYLISIVGGLIIKPAQFLSFDFYRRDGNLFISFTPLIILCCTNIKFDIWKTLACFVLISTLADFAGIAYFLIKRPFPEYAMWFTAHNAAGGFLSMLCIATVFVISHYFKNGFYALTFIACLFINLFGLYLTNSRGSILPFILAIFIFFLVKLNKKLDVIVFFLAFVVLFIVEIYIMSVRGEETLIILDEYYVPSDFENHPFFTKFLAIFTRSNTVVNRMFYLWCRALYLFIESPIIGVGFGGFNDTPYSLFGVENVVFLNLSENLASNSSHAHNTFFHVLAEQGVIGFILLIVIIFQMKKSILKEKDRALRSMLLIMLFYAIGSSFFEHRFFTPAQMIPFLLILGIAISNRNYTRKYGCANKNLY